MELRVAILTQKVNKKSGKKEWCLVSKKDRSKVLEWYGTKKPSKERIEKTERRVQFFKHKKGSAMRISEMIREGKARPKNPKAPQEVYSYEFLSAVADWQNYGGSDKSTNAAMLKLKVPPALARTSAKVLYRIVSLPLETIQALLSGKTYKYKNASSWTKSLKIAKDFRLSLWFRDMVKRGNISAVLKTAPRNVILDIEALYKDPRLQEAITWHETHTGYFAEGLEFGGGQREVVLGPMTLRKQELALLWTGKKWVKPTPKIIDQLIS